VFRLPWMNSLAHFLHYSPKCPCPPILTYLSNSTLLWWSCYRFNIDHHIFWSCLLRVIFVERSCRDPPMMPSVFCLLFLELNLQIWLSV
jgi:hypothetical protein